MKMSSEGLAVLHYFESCKLKAYPDPGSRDGKPWTIGWGHTGPEVCKGLAWTQDQADNALEDDLQRYEDAVDAAAKVDLDQHQFDALVSFAFNCGISALKGSTLLRKVNAGDFEGAAREFGKWTKNDGRVMRGLVRRRKAEEVLFRGKTAREAISAAQDIA